MADPFGCFESDEEPANGVATDEDAAPRRRPDDCGVLSYHAHTEYSMLAHVRNSVAATGAASGDGGARATAVLGAIDGYCADRHWMMHVGPDKGSILREELGRSAARFASASGGAGRGRRRYVCVELGTYCGYSAVLMADALHAAGEGMDWRVYTLEADPRHAAVAEKVIELAGMKDVVTQVAVELDSDGNTIGDLAGVVAAAISARGSGSRATHGREGEAARDVFAPQIYFLFVDHDKAKYLTDLHCLERSGLIRAETVVVADNTVFACIDDYTSYVRKLDRDGIVRTRTVEAKVEYSAGEGEEPIQVGWQDQFRDGMEITTYLQDPQQ